MQRGIFDVRNERTNMKWDLEKVKLTNMDGKNIPRRSTKFLYKFIKLNSCTKGIEKGEHDAKASGTSQVCERQRYLQLLNA